MHIYITYEVFSSTSSNTVAVMLLSPPPSLSSIVIMSFGNSSLTDKLDSHDENVDFALEKVLDTAVTVFLALGVLFIDLN